MISIGKRFGDFVVSSRLKSCSVRNISSNEIDASSRSIFGTICFTQLKSIPEIHPSLPRLSTGSRTTVLAGQPTGQTTKIKHKNQKLLSHPI